MAMIADKQSRSESTAGVAAAEAEIEATRRRLDQALTTLRQDLALPIAVVAGAAAILHGSSDATPLREFLRHNAVPLGIIALGTGWLAVQNRDRIANLAGAYGGELLEKARSVGTRMAEAALSAAIDEIGRASASSPIADDVVRPTAVPGRTEYNAKDVDHAHNAGPGTPPEPADAAAKHDGHGGGAAHA
jgi:hypothetical protein